MLSLKVKNYVLVGYGGERVFRGASVRSRADELFGREFIARAVDLLVEGKTREVAELYKAVAAEIEGKKMPLLKFLRRERITEKTFTSDARRRLAEAARGASVGEYITVYQKADGSLGRADEYGGDEDTRYLLEKLYKFAGRLREAFGDEFDALFPKPSAKTKAEAAGQQTLF
jgi:DNA polymerase elongation subunit (family B)